MNKVREKKEELEWEEEERRGLRWKIDRRKCMKRRRKS